MHSSHLPLTKWFSAVYLIAAHTGSVSARQLQTRLRIGYQPGSVLTRKLQLTETPVDSESLRGRIEVAQTEISFKVFDPFLRWVTSHKRVVAIALELPDAEPAKPNLPTARGFNRIRLAVVPNSSPAWIEPFIRDNVQRGAVLLTEDLDSFLELQDHGYDLRDFGETPSHAQQLFSALKDWFSSQAAPRSDPLEARLQGFSLWA